MGKIHVILPPNALEMVNDHFVDDSFPSIRERKDLVDVALASLKTFCSHFVVVFTTHKTNFLLVCLDALQIEPPLLSGKFTLGLMFDI